MPRSMFNREEIDHFLTRFNETPAWAEWRRHQGSRGEDVLEILVGGAHPATLRITKTEQPAYLATGFDGWALTVSDDFKELLRVLARMSQRRSGRNRDDHWSDQPAT